MERRGSVLLGSVGNWGVDSTCGDRGGVVPAGTSPAGRLAGSDKYWLVGFVDIGIVVAGPGVNCGPVISVGEVNRSSSGIRDGISSTGYGRGIPAPVGYGGFVSVRAGGIAGGTSERDELIDPVDTWRRWLGSFVSTRGGNGADAFADLPSAADGVVGRDDCLGFDRCVVKSGSHASSLGPGEAGGVLCRLWFRR